jgi:histidine triad (HIT) family protein
MPVAHYSNLGDFSGSDEQMLGKLLRVAHEVAGKEGLENGYRLIINEGEDGGKLVPHLHIHLLGGKKLGAKIVS